ncbi:ribonuclease domain-containing protein [Thauera sp. JM12B12]|uniref:ribonuclease domain-containing protein n=1 Tax=Thauera sp. JM12B12 TaxID=3142262 RepID=UPI0031F3D9A7
MLRLFLARLALLLVFVGSLAACSPPAGSGSGLPSHAGLPPEAIETLGLIQRGGPFPYRKDGTTFQNRERLLPAKPRGYYREYTVPTPGSRDRGARRIVAGGNPPEVFYYTADHYRSFRQIEPLP